MSRNLAENQNRQTRQQEQIGRRASIIDERRNTRAPDYQGAATMRTARRGDGGAAELRRVLGLVQNAGSDLVNYSTAKHIDDEKDNIAEGAADQAAGIVDEQMMEKSLGYRNAVTKGRTVTNFASAAREFNEELETVIEGQDYVSLEERQAEAEGMIEGFYQNFAQDPETGELRDYLQSPGAMRYLAETIQNSRPKAMAAAQARIEERFNAEAVGHYGQNIVDQAIDTGMVDLSAARDILPDTVTDEQVAEATLVSVNNAVEALRAEGRFAEAVALLGGLRGFTDKPLETGTGTSRPTGTAPAGTAPAGSSLDTFRNPVGGRVTDEFGKARSTGSHNGVDLAVPVGTPVPAAMGGEVVRAWSADAGGVSLKVKYDDGTVVGFAHLSEQTIKEGRFEAGAQLALTGNTGKSTGPHLHYTMTRDGKKINPLEADFGAMPEAAPTEADPAETPQFTLRDPNADPVTALEQSGELVDIIGLEDITFSPQQRARIGELYKSTSDQMRREWKAQQSEDQSQNAASLALGTFGVGGVSTLDDVMTAYEKGEIDDDQVLALVRMHEAKEDRRVRDDDRQESRLEREERKRVERKTQAGSEILIGKMIRGEITPAQARSAALIAAGNLSSQNTEIGSNIVATVNSMANAMDSAVMKSEPVIKAQTEFAELADEAATYVTTLEGVPRHKQKQAGEEFVKILDRASAVYMRKIVAGAKPEEAQEASDAFILREEAAMIASFKPPAQPQY